MTGHRGTIPSLSVTQASAMLIGIVVGIGIFKTPPVAAANVDSEAAFLLLWLVGGALTMVGALCYAELGSARPSAGGEYHFLHQAYGRGLSFLFAWGRMSVMQSGAIAAVAFAYGDYASALVPLGPMGPAIHAALAIVVLTALQLVGTNLSGRLQFWLTALTVIAVLAVAAAGFMAEPPPGKPEARAPASGGALGLAMVFILLTYGGWNEAAYLSGEIRDVRRNMVRVLLIGTGLVTALYVLINLSLITSLGLERLKAEKLLTEPVEQVFGRAGGLAVALIICVATLSTLNGTIFTGARSILALGAGFAPLAAVGRRSARTGAPANALLAQAGIALVLIAFGATARDGFTAIVEYTAPVFWFFMLLVGASLFVFRWREPGRPIPYRVPLYPLTPLVFCATALYLMHASIAYTGTGSLVGVAILLAGIPLYLFGRDTGAAGETSARSGAVQAPGE